MLVEPRIQVAEIERSRRERPGSVAAYDIYLQALPKINNETESENAEAYALLTAGAGARARQPAAARRMPPGRSSTAARWDGRPSGRTTGEPCAELARRGLQRAARRPRR